MTLRRTQRRCGARPRARGLTLLEVLVAMLVAAAGFGALMTALSQSKRAQAGAGRAERELALARTLLEQGFVRALPEQGRSQVSSGVERWVGVTDGLPWTVETVATTMHARDLRTRGATQPEPLTPGGASPDPLVPTEILRVEVGRVKLSATRW